LKAGCETELPVTALSHDQSHEVRGCALPCFDLEIAGKLIVDRNTGFHPQTIFEGRLEIVELESVHAIDLVSPVQPRIHIEEAAVAKRQDFTGSRHRSDSSAGMRQANVCQGVFQDDAGRQVSVDRLEAVVADRTTRLHAETEGCGTDRKAACGI